jgi:hypothetical protein
MNANEARQAAVMTVDEGEEIIGGWATAPIPGVGFYKLLAKRKRDGTCEWAHFIQRDNGARTGVTRGTVPTAAKMNDVLEVMNGALRKTFGPHIQLRSTVMSARTLDGQPISDTRH